MGGTIAGYEGGSVASTITIAKDFSPYPAGRFCSDGPNSGERFREEFLLPNIEQGTNTTIIFNGARGYGSSFLEEAFGGLVRKGFTPELVLSTFQLESSDESLISEVEEYIKKANG